MQINWTNLEDQSTVLIQTESKLHHIDSTAYIGNNVYLGKNTRIGPYAKLGNNIHIGDNVYIGFNCVIQDNDPCTHPICLPMFPGNHTKDCFATTITPSWITFACTAKTPQEWWSLSDREIIAASENGIGKGNVNYWKTYKEAIFTIAAAAGYWTFPA